MIASKVSFSNQMFLVTLIISLHTATLSAPQSLSTDNDSNVRENNKTMTSCAVQGDDVDMLGCPAWFKPGKHNGSCQCGDNIEPNLIHCDSATNRTKISLEFCATYDTISGTVLGGDCPYNYLRDSNSIWFEAQQNLPCNVSELNEAMCGPLNRTGLLCSQCKEGLGPPVLSYENRCLECFDSRYGWLVYVIAALGPTTVFCIIIIVCRINATTPTLNLMIMVCQVLVSLAYVNANYVYNVESLGAFVLGILSFYGLWNLDFFLGVLPPFCISPKMNSLQVIALDYLVALYPLVLTAIVYYCIEFHDRGYRVLVVLWKPFHPCFVHFRRTLGMEGSIINVFATFLFLSYCKLVYISNSLLRPMYLFNGCGEKTKLVVYSEPSIDFMKGHHLLYVIFVIIFLAVFIFLPLVYILFYQNRLFQRCLYRSRLNITLFSELAKVCHKSYKDGQNGTPDYRWYAGVYLIYRILFLVLTMYVPVFFDLQGFFSIVMLTVLSTLLCAFLQPYKNKFFNVFDSLFLCIFTLGIMYYNNMYLVTGYSNNYSIVPVVLIAALPLFYFICFFTLKLVCKLKSLKCFQALIQAVKNRIEVPDRDQDIIPYRLEHPGEYQPLL